MTDPTPPPGDPPTPPMAERELGVEELDQLFQDLADHASVQMLMVKHTDRREVGINGQPKSLAEARLHLDGQDAVAVQIRYTFERKQWIDTICRADQSFKLIRVCPDFVASGTPEG